MQYPEDLSAFAPHSAYTVSVANTKGGVGKSTTTANLAALCADLGQRVLIIDCDRQGTVSKYFRVKEQSEFGLSAALSARRIDGRCISSTAIERLDLIRYDDEMDRTLVDLAAEFNSVMVLDRAIDHLRDSDVYDLIFIDTPGASGLMQDIGIVPADLIVAPVIPETLAAREVGPLIKLLKRYEDGMPNSRQSAAERRPVITRVPNTANAKQLTGELRAIFSQLRGRFRVCDTAIPNAAVYDKASSVHLPIHHIEPRKNGVLGANSVALYQLLAELLPHLYDRIQHEISPQEGTGTGP